MLPVMRRARDLGSFATDADLSLMNSTTQFLGGLKLAISQNLQARFVVEFEKTSHELARRHIDYVKERTYSRVALATLSALFGAMAVLVGFGALNISPPVLITLLLVLTRMSGPAAQIQQAVGQLAYDLPAYEKLRELEEELAAIPRERPWKIPRQSSPMDRLSSKTCRFIMPTQSVTLSAKRGTIGPCVARGISAAGSEVILAMAVSLKSPRECGGRLIVD
jgi:ABC-type multidrug transport system fused ATPase/permease subunit